jgi:farnesyl-diphosphate farnesyltransferase
MALATFSLFYNNHDLFTKTGTKIRRGVAVKLMSQATDMESIKKLYFEYATQLNDRCRLALGTNPQDKSFYKISTACANVILFLITLDCQVDSSR